MSTGPRLAERDIPREVQEMGPWFHNLHLPDGTETAPDHPLGDFPRFKWDAFKAHVPDDLTGWTALDVGCNAGFYAFELAKRGAHVTGIDADPRYLKQAEWAARVLGLEDRVRFERKQVYDLAHEDGKYDLVLFLGVLYHLRYPLLGLDAVARRVGRLMVFQTLTAPGDAPAPDTSDRALHERDALRDPAWPHLAFIEHAFAGDESNWWVPNRTGAEAMLRASGLRVAARAEDETWVCAPDPGNPAAIDTWDRSEWLSATGRAWSGAGAGAEDAKFRPSPRSIESVRRR